MAKYSLVMTPTPCKMSGCIISIRPTASYAGVLTYFHNWPGAYKTGNISKTVKDKSKVNVLYKVVHGLSIAAKMTLNNLCARFNVIDS